jgi:hypothetical protein
MAQPPVQVPTPPPAVTSAPSPVPQTLVVPVSTLYNFFVANAPGE